jgi:hypothetical protein
MKSSPLELYPCFTITVWSCCPHQHIPVITLTAMQNSKELLYELSELMCIKNLESCLDHRKSFIMTTVISMSWLLCTTVQCSSSFDGLRIMPQDSVYLLTFWEDTSFKESRTICQIQWMVISPFSRVYHLFLYTTTQCWWIHSLLQWMNMIKKYIFCLNVFL